MDNQDSKHDEGILIEMLQTFNDTVNSSIEFVTDSDHWKLQDYWQTPKETKATRKGDCEDYAIYKYFRLKEFFFPIKRMFLSYVISSYKGPHMVLLIHAQKNHPQNSPTVYVLDNLQPKVQHITYRNDLKEVYRFNEEGIFIGSKKVEEVNKLKPWEDLLDRISRGF